MSPVLVALDVPTSLEAVALAERLVPHVGGFKVGLELLLAEGPSAVSKLAELGAPVFADAKLHDIPNTVGRAAARLGSSGARWVTVHAAGGAEMMTAATRGLAEGAEGPCGVLAVTVLTSLDDAALNASGVSRSLPEQVAAMARLAAASGAEGVVCAVDEARTVGSLGLGLTVVTPGIRPAGAGWGDQKRAATPKAAIEAGADLLVVGRPITSSPDPVAAAIAIAEEIAAVSAAHDG